MKYQKNRGMSTEHRYKNLYMRFIRVTGDGPRRDQLMHSLLISDGRSLRSTIHILHTT